MAALVKYAMGLAVMAGVLLAGALPANRASADPSNVLLLSPSLCLAFTSDAPVAGCLSSVGLSYANMPGVGSKNLRELADRLGDNDGRVEPEDFAAMDLDGNQVHQRDGANSAALSRLAVLAFVENDAPVTFHTNAGFFVAGVSAVGQTFTCTDAMDPDCGGGPRNSPNPVNNEDGVVVAYLACSIDTCPELGKHKLTVEQDGIVFPVEFTVVGEPRKIEFLALETAMQAGVGIDASGQPDCEFQANLAFVQKSLGEAEKTVIVARAIDAAGNSVAGAWVQWTTTDADKIAIAQSPVTPTLDLGAFGFGAPNIICARRDAKPGEAKVVARLRRTMPAPLPPLLVDPLADFGNPNPNDLAFSTITYKIAAIPAKVSLAVDPPQMVCDGKAGAKVSATLTDADGNPAIAGTKVRFDVRVLGTASPIETVTDDKGVATTTVTPLASSDAGVPVIVTVPVAGIQASALVKCGAGAPAAAPPPAAPPPAAPGGAPAGVTRPPAVQPGLPRSGDSGLDRATVVPWLGLGALAGLATALTAAGVVAKRRAR